MSAFIVFALASITDWVDGFLARLWKAETAFGRLFDPLADKFLVVGTTIILFSKDYLPALLFFVIILRDILLILGSLLVFLKKIPMTIQPSRVSKINTAFQLMLVGGVLLFDYSYQLYYSVTKEYSFLSVVMTIGAVFTFITTLWSGLIYGAVFVRALRQRGNS